MTWPGEKTYKKKAYKAAARGRHDSRTPHPLVQVEQVQLGAVQDGLRECGRVDLPALRAARGACGSVSARDTRARAGVPYDLRKLVTAPAQQRLDAGTAQQHEMEHGSRTLASGGAELLGHPPQAGSRQGPGAAQQCPMRRPSCSQTSAQACRRRPSRNTWLRPPRPPAPPLQGMRGWPPTDLTICEEGNEVREELLLAALRQRRPVGPAGRKAGWGGGQRSDSPCVQPSMIGAGGNWPVCLKHWL